MGDFVDYSNIKFDFTTNPISFIENKVEKWTKQPGKLFDHNLAPAEEETSAQAAPNETNKESLALAKLFKTNLRK
jgi:hypothetical protein